MRNLIKMNFYRLSRSISAYILVILSIIGVVMTSVFYHYNRASVEVMRHGAVYDEGMAIFEFIDAILGDGFMLIFIMIGVTLFIGSQYKSGFIKNFAGNCPNRAEIVGADIVVSCTFTLLLMAVAIGATCIVNLTLNSEFVAVGELSDTLNVIVPKLMPLLGYTMLIVFIVEAFRSTTASIITGFLFTTLSPFAASCLNSLLHRIGVPQSFNISEFFIDLMITESAMELDPIKASIIGAVYFVVFAVISIVMFRKRDIV